MIRQLLLLLAVWLLPVVGVSGTVRADEVRRPAVDARQLPPATREFLSPSGQFALVLASADHWKTHYAEATLAAVNGVRRQPLWQQTLPHEKGPRRVLVMDSGAVLLLDEWINVPSRHAFMLISPEGKTLAHYSIDELIAKLGVSRRTIADNGKLGIWLSSTPVVKPDGMTVEFRAGGRGLLLELSDGRLSATK